MLQYVHHEVASQLWWDRARVLGVPVTNGTYKRGLGQDWSDHRPGSIAGCSMYGDVRGSVYSVESRREGAGYGVLEYGV